MLCGELCGDLCDLADCETYLQMTLCVNDCKSLAASKASEDKRLGIELIRATSEMFEDRRQARERKLLRHEEHREAGV